MKPNIPIKQKKDGGNFYLRKSFHGTQREICLDTTNAKDAKTRAIRFIATAEKNDFDAAVQELKGKPVIKAGANPTFEEMAILYREFCQQSVKSPREKTINHNLARLKCLMSRAGFKTIGQIDKSKLAKSWFKDGSNPTHSEKRTFASAISAASGVFQKHALEYYAARKVPVSNPFANLQTDKPKVEPYHPISDELRQAIFNDCQTELEPENALIVLMALGIGLRRSEIEAAVPSWFSKQGDKVMVNIRETGEFRPKSGKSGMVPIHPDLYETLLRLRGKSESPYFVASDSKKTSEGRIWERVRTVNKWLRSKGLNDRKPLHALRKECGSHIAKKYGILEASKILRNTTQVCSIHYAGIAETHVVDICGNQKPKDPFEELANQLGITVEEVRRKLEMPAD